MLRFLFNMRLLQSILKPITRPLFRLLLGMIAIPLFRFLCRRVLKIQDLDEEIEKDLEQWFKASLVLLAATKNMEMALFGELLGAEDDLSNPWVTGLRIMMAIGVTELMPDQELFAIIHPGPPRFVYDRQKGFWRCLREQAGPIGRGLWNQHVNRSSPVFAILCTIFVGVAGWICFGLAIAQYLYIALVTSRDRALDVLSEFDKQISLRRQEIQEQMEHAGTKQPARTAETQERPAGEEPPALPSVLPGGKKS